MDNRKYATIFHDPGNFRACIVSKEETVWHDGISDRNIDKLVQAVVKVGYHVTLYTVDDPKFFA